MSNILTLTQANAVQFALLAPGSISVVRKVEKGDTVIVIDPDAPPLQVVAGLSANAWVVELPNIPVNVRNLFAMLPDKLAVHSFLPSNYKPVIQARAACGCPFAIVGYSETFFSIAIPAEFSAQICAAREF